MKLKNQRHVSLDLEVSCKFKIVKQCAPLHEFLINYIIEWQHIFRGMLLAMAARNKIRALIINIYEKNGIGALKALKLRIFIV